MKKDAVFFAFFVISFSQIQAQDYLGQWRNSDTTEIVEVTNDTIFKYEIDDDCYRLTKVVYTDTYNNILLFDISGQIFPVSYVLENSNTELYLATPLGSESYYSYQFDINNYQPCSISYRGKWMTSLPPLIYFEFTSDSLFIFRFDLDVCYTSNHLTCIDAGNNQLLISSLVPTNYYLSSDGELMAIDIVGLGDLELERTTYDNSGWIECNNWKCNTEMGNCLEVDDNSGDYTNEQYCIANCQADTSSSDSSSSVHEFYMDIAIYPNPFTHSTTLEFKEKVNYYQLFDVFGRLLFSKTVDNTIDYLHRGNLSRGVYFLQFVGDQKISRRRVVIE